MLKNSDDLCSLEDAESEIVASLIVRPDHFSRLKRVESEWFSRGEDRALWQAYAYAASMNDGIAEPATAMRFLAEKYPEQATQLTERIVGHIARNYGAGPIAESLFDYHLGLVRNNGVRRAHWKWSRRIALCCEQRQPLDELRLIVNDRPDLGEGVER
jgi:hypothetical protein